MYKIKQLIKKFTPKSALRAYHFLFSWFGSVVYKDPSKKIFVIGVTGTKGKSSTIEISNAIFEKAGFKTAIASTIRFKVGSESKNNKKKMTMPGRFFLQKFLQETVEAKCDVVFIEMTSEGSKQFRHRFIHLDSLVVTNLSPEHIESHGSYKKYIEAKLNIAKQLIKSDKENKTLIINNDIKEKERFINIVSGKDIEIKTYSLNEARPYAICSDTTKLTLFNKPLSSPLVGEFNIYNILAAKTVAEIKNIDKKIIIKTIESFDNIPGRMEKVTSKNQTFDIIVDYAHTPESLEQVYQSLGDKRKICVLGGTGGGRDNWKREVMGKIADKCCHEIILTNEDPYDENPEKILDDIVKGISTTPYHRELDRRKAISLAISKAKEDSVVIITGKGTDAYIMEANGNKTPWSDTKVAHEELEKSLS